MRNTDKPVVGKHLSSSPHTLLHPIPVSLLPSIPQIAKARESQQDTNQNHKLSQLPPYVICINVGGRAFTTTTNTMKKSVLFNKLLSQKDEDAQPPTIAKREISFANYCTEYKDKEVSLCANNTNNEENGIYQINSNYYFVDRSPDKFDDILHFLRNYPTINAQQFIERYCCVNTISHQQQQQQMTRNHSLSSVVSASTTCRSTASVNHNIHLLKLQDEARFYKIDPLINAIQEKLDFNKYNKVDFKWWDRSGSLRGLRRIGGTRIAFATAMDNWVGMDADFEIPNGFTWATQSQYLAEFHSKRDVLSGIKEWIHFGIGDWKNYRWKYARKVAFIFRDTFKGLRFVHSGMEVCDINHVKSLAGYMSESPLMEFDDAKGITEGFAGLVLLSDEVYNESAPAAPDEAAPASEASSWTSDEDDEQIQSLKAQQLSNNSARKKKGNEEKTGAVQVSVNVNQNNENKLCKPKTATVATVAALPAMLGGNCGDYRKRATLTKNNLMKHTAIENEKHENIRKNNHHTRYSFNHLMQQTPPQYIHHQLPRFNYIGSNQIPTVPAAPQLMPRLSVNSLPAPNTSHHHINPHKQ
eukprot:8412_1